jgi:prevent-host-death family protein
MIATFRRSSRVAVFCLGTGGHGSGYHSVQTQQKRRALNRWELQDANQKLSRLVDRARSDGPRVVTRSGKEVAVVLGFEDYRRLTPDGGEVKRFLSEGADFDVLQIERAGESARAVDL